jgi:predicted nucleic acid-binding Zn ribbon protein
VTELVQAMTDPTPEAVDCECCDMRASRVFTAPAAVVFRGRGFYSTDVKGRIERRRRRNAGDSLHRGFDTDAAAIAKTI